MEINKEMAREAKIPVDSGRSAGDFYIISLAGDKRNSKLLDDNGHLKTELKRNIDYSIVPQDTWRSCSDCYDIEIPALGVYNLFISFSCHGLSYKNIYVHGSEVVFDVIQALFVNKMFSIDSFKSMFDVKWNDVAVDPTVNFEWFGKDLLKIILTVQKKINFIREEQSSVLESITVNDTGEHPLQNNLFERELSMAASFRNNQHRISEANIKMYSNLYTVAESCKEEPYKKSYSNSQLGFLPSQLKHSTEINGGGDLIEPFNNKKIYFHPSHQESVGILNIGNTCYMNSSIQCLNNCRFFSNFFLLFHNTFQNQNRPPPFKELEKNKNYHENEKIIESWAELLFSLNTQTIASPKDLKNALSYKNSIFIDFKEQDAAEFIGAILAYLHEGLCYDNRSHKSSSVQNTLPIEEYKSLDPDAGSRGLFNEPNSFLDNNDSELIKFGHENSRISKKASASTASPNASESKLNARLTKEYDELINVEKSIVSDLFFGMYTNFMECEECGFKKHKSDLIMILPLPIPNEVRYHSSTILIRSARGMPLKILAPLNYTIRKLIEEVKEEYSIDNDILAVEYSDCKAIEFISEAKIIRNVANRIHLYEYSKSKKYYLCSLYHYKYVFFKRKLPIEFLVEEHNQKTIIYEKLSQYFSKPLGFSDFYGKVSLLVKGPDSVYNLPVIELTISEPEVLFGSNFSILSRPLLQKSNDLSLRDCLNYCYKPEYTEVQCENCKKSCRYEMMSRLTRYPKYLIIHLKRFSYHSGGSKISTFIDFPLDHLRLDGNSYMLIGTANHLEIGLGYGHYVSYIRKNNEWYCCNDSVISKAACPDKASAYILFYEKIDEK